MTRNTNPTDTPDSDNTGNNDTVENDTVSQNLDRTAHRTDHDRIETAIKDLQTELDLPAPTVKTTIEYINRLTNDEDWAYTRGYEITCAAATRIACKKHNTPRQRDETAAVTNSDAKALSRERKKIADELEAYHTPVEVEAWITRYTNKLGIEELRPDAVNALETVQENRPTASPVTHAAGAIWYAIETNGEENILTKKTLADTTNVTTVSIRGVTPELINDDYRDTTDAHEQPA